MELRYDFIKLSIQLFIHGIYTCEYQHCYQQTRQWIEYEIPSVVDQQGTHNYPNASQSICQYMQKYGMHVVIRVIMLMVMLMMVMLIMVMLMMVMLMMVMLMMVVVMIRVIN
eukprot:NODE_293_length_11597_cov_0.181771.p8 type:complete len:112 gc:universal NODE_293_length_11597_cov_0.181771:2309-2644(+)